MFNLFVAIKLLLNKQLASFYILNNIFFAKIFSFFYNNIIFFANILRLYYINILIIYLLYI